MVKWKFNNCFNSLQCISLLWLFQSTKLPCDPAASLCPHYQTNRWTHTDVLPNYESEYSRAFNSIAHQMDSIPVFTTTWELSFLFPFLSGCRILLLTSRGAIMDREELSSTSNRCSDKLIGGFWLCMYLRIDSNTRLTDRNYQRQSRILCVTGSLYIESM